MSQFYVGQKVYDVLRGEGVVESIDHDFFYPLSVVFKDDSGINSEDYSLDGKRHKDDLLPSLYTVKPKIVVPKWQPTPGQWCWFWDREDFIPRFHKFDTMQGGKYRDMDNLPWENCEPFIGELPSYLKEVQP